MVRLKDRTTVVFLLFLWALFLGAIISNYAYREPAEPGMESAIVDFLEANYTGGKIATDLEYVTKNFKAPMSAPTRARSTTGPSPSSSWRRM
jgi:hypothetical protein